MHKKLFTSLLVLACLAFSFAQSAAGTISNTATASFGDIGRTASSNEVTAIIPSFCAVNVSPDGSSAAPAYSVAADAGDTLYFTYFIENQGSIASLFNLTIELSGSLAPSSSRLILDSNLNGVVDEGELELTDLTLAFAESATVILELSLPADDSFGVTEFNVVAACAADPSVRDDDNVSVVTVAQGGVTSFVKSSTPASGSVLAAGEALSYVLRFDLAERDLTNVVLSDVLDLSLSEPSALRVLLNGVAVDAASFDVTSRTVSASFASLAAGDRVELFIDTAVRADALGSVVIRNVAEIRHDDGDDLSNELTHSVLSECGVLLTPDGGLLAPAHEAALRANSSAVFPYVLRNTGNSLQTFDLVTSLLSESSAFSFSLWHDLNANELLDESEPLIESIELNASESANLLLFVELTNSVEADIDVVASCSAFPDVQDNTNVTHISQVVEGSSAPLKSSDPPSDTPLHAGANLTYFIEFQANDLDLENVVVTDVLSEFLIEPLSFTEGLITDPLTGLNTTVTANFDNGTVTWQFERIPAGMHIKLELNVQVRSDLTFEESRLLRNVAVVSISGDESPTNATTNTVIHEIRPLSIVLKKTAFPAQVRMGDSLTYSLEVRNPSDSVRIEKLELSDDLPVEVAYLPNTSRLVLSDGSESVIVPEVSGQMLVWNLPALAIGDFMTVVFDVEILPEALASEEIINTAGVVASDAAGRATADAAAAASTLVDTEGFRAPALLVGTVFLDLNDNSVFDDSDLGVEGVRLYLSDGRAILSDKDGRYTFLSLEPGVEVLKVDQTTLPARYLKETQSEVSEGLWRIRLEPGHMTRQDVPLLPAGARLSVDQVLNVFVGPVSLKKQLVSFEDNQAFVVLTVRSESALPELEIQDGEQVFVLGDVEAGFEQVIRYELIGDKDSSLTAPIVRWRLR